MLLQFSRTCKTEKRSMLTNRHDNPSSPSPQIQETSESNWEIHWLARSCIIFRIWCIGSWTSKTSKNPCCFFTFCFSLPLWLFWLVEEERFSLSLSSSFLFFSAYEEPELNLRNSPDFRPVLSVFFTFSSSRVFLSKIWKIPSSLFLKSSLLHKSYKLIKRGIGVKMQQKLKTI